MKLTEPPLRMIEMAIERSLESPCRSKRGAVLFRENLRVGSGYNHKPFGFDCDGSAACKATCRHEAVHAEQAALFKAGLNARGCEALHVKTVEGSLVPSGPPSCAQCSKLLLDAGVTGVWLYHADGWRRYAAADFHRLSLSAMSHETPLRAQIEQLLWGDKPNGGERRLGYQLAIADVLALLSVASAPSTPQELWRQFAEQHNAAAAWVTQTIIDSVKDRGPSVAPAPPPADGGDAEHADTGAQYHAPPFSPGGK